MASLWGSSLPDKPIEQEQVDAVYEKFAIGCEGRNHEHVSVSFEPRMCLVCNKVTWWGISHERNEIGQEFLYKYCICGEHETFREDVRTKKPRCR